VREMGDAVTEQPMAKSYTCMHLITLKVQCMTPLGFTAQKTFQEYQFS
jgi:hypothetical protein